MDNSRTDFITVINSMLVLMDYQTNLLSSVGSGNRKEIRNAVIAAAKAASLLHIPLILTSLNTKENGAFIKELSDMFPGKEIIERQIQHTDAFENEKVMATVRNTRREKLILSGLLTSTSFAKTALHGISEGLDVYGLIDGGGDLTETEHNAGIQRMLEAGVTPLTWMSLTTEWMNGWATADTIEITDDSYGKYGAMLSYVSHRQPIRNYK